MKPCELLRFVVQESASLNQHPFNVSHKPVEVFVAKLMGDNLRQSGSSMAAIDGPAGPSMATKSAINGPAGPVVAGDHLRRDRTRAKRSFQSGIVRYSIYGQTDLFRFSSFAVLHCLVATL